MKPRGAEPMCGTRADEVFDADRHQLCSKTNHSQHSEVLLITGSSGLIGSAVIVLLMLFVPLIVYLPSHVLLREFAG